MPPYPNAAPPPLSNAHVLVPVPHLSVFPRPPFLCLPIRSLPSKLPPSICYETTLCSAEPPCEAFPEVRMRPLQRFQSRRTAGRLVADLPRPQGGPNGATLVLKCLGMADSYTGNNLISACIRYGMTDEFVLKLTCRHPQ
ncbi:hypothetical protein MLD38_000421 [Melastoma candidum]|uniref:Uncharacterized protein n=1 Tax=Melastoma candidum TaxID=119954 RepID=A0ACB9SA58_9MYRT|nr:hypothetical protein MLD38_000421 [Melastoma candidum]